MNALLDDIRFEVIPIPATASIYVQAECMEAAWTTFSRWVGLIRSAHDGDHEMYPSIVMQLAEQHASAQQYDAAAALLGENMPTMKGVLGESREYCNFVGTYAQILERVGGRHGFEPWTY